MEQRRKTKMKTPKISNPQEKTRTPKITNTLKLLKTPVQQEGIYNVEQELIYYARIHAQFFIQRYRKEHPDRHWTANQERNNFVGMLGHKAFHLVCQQFAVPVDYNDPLLDWRLSKDYDFKLANGETVEVKCFDYNLNHVLVKTREWHGNDYLVIFKFLDVTPSIVHLKGWLTRKQVEALPISKKGERLTPYADAYATDFNSLNSPSQFIEMLKQTAKQQTF
jgi:hypothetical protein